MAAYWAQCLLFLGVFFLPLIWCQSFKATAPVCSYFGGGRMPKEAYSLSNCTWYRENACCERTEVMSVFSEMPALVTNNKGCYNRMNYLMCYFCSPKQHLWFNGIMSVCRSYCNEIYDFCGSAQYNGVSIAGQYKNGVEFCKAQMFNVIHEENLEAENCFQFNPAHFDSGSKTRISKLLMVTILSTGFNILCHISGG